MASEIVYTNTDEQNRDLVDRMVQDHHSRMTLDTKLTIFQSPGKVAIAGSTLVVGIPRGHPNKRYYKWRTIITHGLRRLPSGTVTAWSAQRSWDGKVKDPWRHRDASPVFNFLNDSDDAGQAFKFACLQEFGRQSLSDFYPMVNDYGLISYRTIPSSLRTAFREDNWLSYSAAAFGKTRVSPRLVAAVANTDPYIVAYAQQFRGLVKNEEMISFMENNRFDEEMEEFPNIHSPNIRPMLLKMDPKAVSNLLKSQMDAADMSRVQRLTYFGRKRMEAFVESDHEYHSLSDIMPTPGW